MYNSVYCPLSTVFILLFDGLIFLKKTLNGILKGLPTTGRLLLKAPACQRHVGRSLFSISGTLK
jgi:hypothetical protein